MELRKNNFLLFKSIIDAYLSKEITREVFVYEWKRAQENFQVNR